MQVNFKCESSTPTKNGTHCVKLVGGTEVKTAFGVTRQRMVRYMFTEEPCAVGTEGPIDLSQWDQVQKEWTPPADPETGEVPEPRILTTLYPKRTEA